MSTEQVVLHANDQELRQRVIATLVTDDKINKAVSPQTDPTPDVIEYRWVWAAEWNAKDVVTDANIQAVVRALWPVPPEEPPVE